MKRIIVAVLLIGGLTGTVCFAATQSTPYILTEFPITLIPCDSAVWIKWTGAFRNALDVPDSGRIYIGKSPGGSIIANYGDSITRYAVTDLAAQNNIKFPGTVPMRGIKFRPSENNMSAGIYYLMVGFKTRIGARDTTFFSNEIKFIVEAKSSAALLYPVTGSSIPDLTPTFRWEKVAGVPYYHIIFSDQEMKPDMANNSLTGLSIIWEAITANTQMTYGAPDPSGTITANPPPLSPGKTYSWAVLNNYGNHPAYSSFRAFGMPSKFTLTGDTLKRPVNVWLYADTITPGTAPTVYLRWRNLDSKANTYKAYLYVSQSIEGITAQMVVWSKEVTAQQFTGDTAYVSFSAKSMLTDNRYYWKVITVDTKGAGTAGDTTSFAYKTPSGTISVKTKENIKAGDEVISKVVGLAEVQMTVLDGSQEAPLLYYTDDNGSLSRKRPVGTYRLTIVKDGFESQSKTITLAEGQTSENTFVLKRPDATVFGKVTDEAGGPIDIAEVKGVSDRGDTVKVNTDPLGNFVMSCYEADWTFTAGKTGYMASMARRASVTYGQNVSLGSALTLKKNLLVLSGIVKTKAGDPLTGAQVSVFRNQVSVAVVPSTPQNGSFSFDLSSGSYQITVSKIGFTSYKTTIDIVGNQAVTVTLQPGAALVTGAVIGASWSKTNQRIYAPITKAVILFIDTTVLPFDTVAATSDEVYGDFSASIGGDKTVKVRISAKGFATKAAATTITTEAGKTYAFHDTLTTLARLSGNVRMKSTLDTVVADATVSLVDTLTNRVIASALSSATGYFELENIPDGSRYQVRAGKPGRVLDSVLITDFNAVLASSRSIIVADGRCIRSDNGAAIDDITAVVKLGSKYLKWALMHGTTALTDTALSIKLKSPMQKILNPSDILSQIGIGTYICAVTSKSASAERDSLLDCMYHTYSLPDNADSMHTDTVYFPFVHHAADTVSMTNQQVTIGIRKRGIAADSGYILYKEMNAANFDSVSYTYTQQDSTYRFTITSNRDACFLSYYFKMYCRTSGATSIYGHSQQLYQSFIKPDTAVVTKVSLSPYASDTLLFAPHSEVEFVYKGYYSSLFLPIHRMPAQTVQWNLFDGADCSLQRNPKDSACPATTLLTGAGSADAVHLLKAHFVKNGPLLFSLASGVPETLKVFFRVSVNSLESLTVSRTDPDEKGYITTSPLSQAHFTVQGVDAKGTRCVVTPVWKLDPAGAGTFNEGVFKPADDFIGTVRISCRSGKVAGEYMNPVSKTPGLAVYYLMTGKKDTVNSGKGCCIVLPDNIIGTRALAKLSMTIPEIKNKAFEGCVVDSFNNTAVSVKFDLISDAYDIKDVDSAIVYDPQSTDSIGISFVIPVQFQSGARSDPQRFLVALWNERKSTWNPLLNSKVSTDGSTITLKTVHFSRYGVIQRPEATGIECVIKPNPFSPYVRPVAEYGNNSLPGTYICVTPISAYSVIDLSLDIYNSQGSRVWSVVMNNPSSSAQYCIPWDGKTMLQPRPLDADRYVSNNGMRMVSVPGGGQYCRNGRYFLIARVKDADKEVMVRKQIILFK